MPIVLFSDIDDTLIQTKAKCPEGAALEVGGFDKLGEPLSYITEQQRKLITQFERHEFIPVTGRNKSALDRVTIPFNSFKVVDHGAIVLDANDELVADWVAAIDELSQVWQPILEQFNAAINDYIKAHELSLRCHIISDFDFPCYISIKGEPEHLVWLQSFAEDFCSLGDNAREHINGHNMALLPPYACKKKAVEFLQQHYLALEPGTLFIAAGDSSSDLPYMNECHFSIIPGTSQITQDKLI